jgi:flagellar motor switch protein FliN/FliY
LTVTNATPAVQKFCDAWRDGFVAVLSQLGVISPSGSVIGQPVPASADAAKLITVRFSAGGVIRSDLFWIAEKPVALQLAQLLKSEPFDPAIELDDSHREAFAELLRQVAAAVSSYWKQNTDSEIELKFKVDDVPAAPSSFSASLRLSGEKIPDLSLSLILSNDLCESLAPTLAGLSQPGTPASPEGVAEKEQHTMPHPVSSGSGTLPSNLDLLLDVELEATIRFGRHEMLLRDIFALMPGAVVELDQMVNEPAELLVAGRLIARGEVVVVDGIFGLQVSEVVSASQRAEILQL